MAATVAISSIDYSAYAARLTSHRPVAAAARSMASTPAHRSESTSSDGVVVSLSSAARERYAALRAGSQGQAASAGESRGTRAAKTSSIQQADTGSQETPSTGNQAAQSATAVRTPDELDEQERQAVQELRSIDTAVRAHEQAHQSAGGRYAGAPSYTYTSGPDNRQYATAGEVPIDASAEQKPRETIEKMKVVERAALAPADPSGQDRAVYAHAVQMEQQAQMQLNAETTAK